MGVRIAVDMTPLGTGGENGGAGLVARSLVRHVSRLKPDWDLVLITMLANNADLADLDARNVHRECASTGAPSMARTAARQALEVLPAEVRVRVKDTARRLRNGHKRAQQVEDSGADLLFCPFTAPYFQSPGTPLVAVVHDLQHVAYPEFFSHEQRLNREQHLRELRASAARIVCVSDFVRRTVLQHTGLPEQRVVTIHNGFLHERAPADATILQSLGVEPGAYVLYPANFWPHKNHERLLQAFSRARQRCLKLVCTGAPNAGMRALAARADVATTVFPGLVPEADFQALLVHCAAVVFPSLYEGFGMPVLEAMAFQKPVLCSDIPALREIAGSAADYFDPLDVKDIARAMASLPTDTASFTRRIEEGRVRARMFGDAEAMARKYIRLFEEVLDAA